MVIMTMLLLSWLALGLERISRRSLIATVAVAAAYVSLFVPLFTGSYLALQLRRDPAKIAEFAASDTEQKRYIAVAAYPGAVGDEALAAMLRDASTRVRVNALVEAGERRNPKHLPLVEEGMAHSQLNVRTKACWALGRIGTGRSLELLRQAARTDPSWYVRDYAYAAAGRMIPETMVVSLDE
jgi:HEAT repeat protein